MLGGLLMVVGLFGVGYSFLNDMANEEKVAQAGHYKLVGCKNIKEVILKKSMNNEIFHKGSRNYIPFTEEEFEVIRNWARNGEHYHESICQAYKNEFGLTPRQWVIQDRVAKGENERDVALDLASKAKYLK